MTSHKKETTGLILALAFMSAGGWLLHFRIHSVLPDEAGVRELENLIPFVVGLVSMLVTPVLLWFARTLILGYLLNGIGAVIGVVLMIYYSTTIVRHPLTLAGILTGTLLADVLIAFAKLFVGDGQDVHDLVVDASHLLRLRAVCPGSFLLEVIVKYLVRGRPGWLVLHAAAVVFFLWMGHFVHF
jgi:hypothetical protein